jgi:hypothetical protein
LRTENDCGIPVHDQQHVITQGVVTWVDSCRRNAYIESNRCGIEIYGQTVRDTMVGAARKMQVGDLVQVDGYLKLYYGLSEFDSLNPATPRPRVTFISANNPVPLPVTVTPAQISMTVSDCSAETFESRLIRVVDVTFAPTADGIFHKGVEYHAGSGTDSIKLYWQTCDSLMDTGNTIPTGPVTVTGILSQHTTLACRCDGYELVSAGDPLAVVQCVTPIRATAMRLAAPADTLVEIRWQAPVGQSCDCYTVYGSDTPQFAARDIIGCTCTDTRIRVRFSTEGNRRFYFVVASAGCR